MLRYPVHIWWDGPGQRYRFDVYGGMDSTGWDLKQGFNWNLYPRIDKVACDFSNGTVGPTATTTTRQWLMGQLGLGDGESSSPLPDISKWEYAGTAQIRNADALVWQLSVRNGEKTANYQFLTARNGWPLAFYMMGRNLITGSHFDEYVIEFTRFKPGPIAAAAFALPGACKDAASREGERGPGEKGQQAAGVESGGVAARMGMLLPAARLGAAPVSAVLDKLRAASETTLEANARFINEHNRRYRAAAATAATAAGAAAASSAATANADDGADAAPSYRLSLNRFAYMTHQQWAASMLGLKPKDRSAGGSAAASETGTEPGSGLQRLRGSGGSGAARLGVYRRVLSDEQLPSFVDWRGTGADGPGVKDQVSCGSCWAFSAVGAMQGAWFKATGQSLSLSEQQLVDCAWDYGNDGCGGGFVEPTLQYVVDAGGVAQEADYPYAGQNTFCRGPIVPPPEPSDDNSTTALGTTEQQHQQQHQQKKGKTKASSPPLSARFSGYVNVPERDEAALMEAVALHGPVAVLMNAALPPFRFYSEGVYYNQECGEDPDSMDHAVLLVGYGTTQEGVDYWLIKNSWSKYWGMDGYARIARKGNDCGITTDPVLAVVDSGAAAQALKADAAAANPAAAAAAAAAAAVAAA
ncbi:hypothetical protein PLESTF_000903600 [Pleodorina starrii]|nr:hypothetical protein PLESTF_000903600 [Pleodorina starrii]